MARTGANSATLLVGDTGSGKSSLLATFAEWVWERFGVQTRYISSDGGGWGDKMEALIQLGIVLVWKVRTRDPDGNKGLVQETIIRASQGWWPKYIDPETGESPLGVEMEPPVAGWKGAIMIDGLSSLCDWSLDELGVRNAAGLLGGEATAIKTLKSGELSLSSANRGGVGFVQGRVQNWINNTLAIRGLVAPPVFTALEQKTTDDDTRLLVYGPKIAGRARMTDVPSWVGNCLGTCLAVGQDGKPEYRLYTMEYRYPSTDTTRHLCGNRTNQMGVLPEYLVDERGKPFTKFNLGHFFDLLAAALQAALDQAKAKLKNAPGLPKSTYDQAPTPAAGGLGAPGGPGGAPSPFALPQAAPPAVASPGGPPSPFMAPPAPAPQPAPAPAPSTPAPGTPPAPPALAPSAPPEAPKRGPGRPKKEQPPAPSVEAPPAPPAPSPAPAAPVAAPAAAPLPPAAPAPAPPPQAPVGTASPQPVGPPQVPIPPGQAQALPAPVLAPPVRPAPPGIRPPVRSPIPAGPAGAKS